MTLPALPVFLQAQLHCSSEVPEGAAIGWPHIYLLLEAAMHSWPFVKVDITVTVIEHLCWQELQSSLLLRPCNDA